MQNLLTYINKMINKYIYSNHNYNFTTILVDNSLICPLFEFKFMDLELLRSSLNKFVSNSYNSNVRDSNEIFYLHIFSDKGELIDIISFTFIDTTNDIVLIEKLIYEIYSSSRIKYFNSVSSEYQNIYIYIGKEQYDSLLELIRI